MNNLRLWSKLFLYRSYCVPVKSTVDGGFSSVITKKHRLVPSKPTQTRIKLDQLPAPTKIDAGTIAHLERLSLVDCANKEGIKTLEDAISFADQILQVETKGVEPLITVLEDRQLQVREDQVIEEHSREEILANAASKEEEYFVSPPGNIPLEARENLLHEKQDAH